MTRLHKSKFYADANLRGLQAQINELWENLSRLGATLASTRFDLEAAIDGPPDPVVAAQTPTTCDPGVLPPDHDALATEVVAEVGEALKPERYLLHHGGFGRYRVLDMDRDSELIHEKKWLTKDEAVELRDKAMQPAE